jgi:hypothetical protein
MVPESSSVRAGSSMAEAVSAGTRGEYQLATGTSTEWKFRPISGISKSNRIKAGTQSINPCLQPFIYLEPSIESVAKF